MNILSDVVDQKVVKNTKFYKLNTETNNLENKIPDVTTLFHINQYETDKKKLRDIDKKEPEVAGLVTTIVLNTKIGEIENKIPDTSGLVTTTINNTKIGEV